MSLQSIEDDHGENSYKIRWVGIWSTKSWDESSLQSIGDDHGENSCKIKMNLYMEYKFMRWK